METFSALLALCAGNSPVTGEFPAQRPVTRSFDVFFDLLLNTRLSKQSWGWWFETPSRPLWRHQWTSIIPPISLRDVKNFVLKSTTLLKQAHQWNIFTTRSFMMQYHIYFGNHKCRGAIRLRTYEKTILRPHRRGMDWFGTLESMTVSLIYFTVPFTHFCFNQSVKWKVRN